MAKQSTFHCSVITPERAVLECDASFVAFPAHDGEMGAMVNRSPLLCRLGVGVLRIESPSEKHTMVIGGGFAQVVDNRLSILTERAKQADEIDAATAEQSLVEARAMKITDEASLDARSGAIRQAQIELRLAKSGK